MSDETHRYMTVRELLEGELKGKASKNTVYRAIADGTIPSIRISPRRILVPSDALERILERQLELRRVGAYTE